MKCAQQYVRIIFISAASIPGSGKIEHAPYVNVLPWARNLFSLLLINNFEIGCYLYCVLPKTSNNKISRVLFFNLTRKHQLTDNDTYIYIYIYIALRNARNRHQNPFHGWVV